MHSGDSACVIPPVSIPQKHIDTIYDYTARIAVELNTVGLMNIQYAIWEDTVYVLEANPRASRTVPLVSKVCGLSMARSATEIMMGRKLGELEYLAPFAAKEVEEAGEMIERAADACEDWLRVGLETTMNRYNG